MRLAGAILAVGVDFSCEHLGGSAGPLLYPVLAFGVCVVVGGMRPHALICLLWRWSGQNGENVVLQAPLVYGNTRSVLFGTSVL